uniref:Uncharacterized protein n=1 Tax=Physcomitrium patens TaxID=3218 RepID=A0A2K1LBR0_PHYPA|nr:hypothetical protein PHYPA_001883 [Physcomitrium patens]
MLFRWFRVVQTLSLSLSLSLYIYIYIYILLKQTCEPSTTVTTQFLAALQYVATTRRRSQCSTAKVRVLKLLRPEGTVTSKGSLVGCLNCTKTYR